MIGPIFFWYKKNRQEFRPRRDPLHPRNAAGSFIHIGEPLSYMRQSNQLFLSSENGRVARGVLTNPGWTPAAQERPRLGGGGRGPATAEIR